MKNFYFTLFLVVIIFSKSFSQAPTCIIYNTSNSGLPDNWVPSFAIDHQGNKWIGTVYGGVSKFDNFSWTVFNNQNSGLSFHNTQAIHVDSLNNKWFVTGWGGYIYKFDDVNWITYDSSNTNGIIWDGAGNRDILTDKNGNIVVGGVSIRTFDGNQWSFLNPQTVTSVYDLALDTSNNLYVGNLSSGLFYYDGPTLVMYTMANSLLPSNSITGIAVEKSGVVWVTNRYDGIVRIDGSNWTIYNTSNTNLPTNNFNTVVIDSNNVKWFAAATGSTNAGNGIVKFDDLTWTTFDTLNSCLTDNDVITLEIDFNNNLWIGTLDEGVIVFNENGVLLDVSEVNMFTDEIKIYPNPASNKLHFSLANEHADLSYEIFNMHQQLVLSGNKLASGKAFEVDCSAFARGLYFVKVYDQSGFVSAKKILLN